MSKFEYPQEIKRTIEALSKAESFKAVWHRQNPDQPMPSVAEMRALVDLMREILFPGYFGSSSTRPDSVKYYIGVKDRKSTRLNSSHVKISYAVFCLKKKKKT